MIQKRKIVAKTTGNVGKYKIVKIFNSTFYNPGQIVSKADIDEMIDHNWTVEIK